MAISSFTLSTPAGATAGDLLIVAVISDQSITIPAAFTSLRSGTVATFFYSVSTLTLTSGQLGGSATWILGGSTTKCTGFMACVHNVSALGNIGLNTFTSPVSSAAAPSINTTTNNEAVVGIWLANAEVGISPPSPLPPNLQVLEYMRGNVSIHWGVGIVASPGATGAMTVTFDAACEAAALLIGVRGTGKQLISTETFAQG